MNKSRNQEFITAFGQRVRAVRKERGLSMERLAQIAGVEYSQVSDIELGHVNTTISTIYTIASALDIPLKDLFDY